MIENSSCKVCLVGDASTVIPVEDVITNETFNYRQCSGCEVVYIDKVPVDLSKYYPTNYYSFSGNKQTVLSRLKKSRDKYEITGKGIAGKLLSFFSSNYTLRSLSSIKLQPQSRLLDSGCGTGKDIRLLKELGFNNVRGADPFIDADVYYNDELLVEKKAIEEVEGSYDFITMHHSFEHVPNPLQIMQEAYRLLVKGGQLMIRIPVADSWAFNHYGKKWVQFDPPRHLFLHTTKSMSSLAEQTRLTLNKVTYDSSDFQYWGSEATKQSKGVHSMSKKEVMYWKLISMIKGYSAKAEKLNKTEMGDQAIFIFQKT
jgi:SAM-dependent methyltransferase